MQIKTALRYHFILVRMALINKSANNKCWRRCGEKRPLCKLVQPLWKMVWRYLRKLQNYHMIQQSHSWAYIQTKRSLKKIHAPVCSLQHFTITKTWKQLICPLKDEGIKKMWYVFTMDYYSAIKKNKIALSAATWMELDTLILSEVSQKEKDKYHMISLITGI